MAYRLSIEGLQEARRRGLESFVSLLILLALSEREEMSCTELADTVDVHKASLTQILDRLVDRGLVARGVDKDDRRRIPIMITADGLAIIQAVVLAVTTQPQEVLP